MSNTITITVEGIERLAQEVLDEIVNKWPRSNACVVGLYGDLGAGKTTFTKKLLEAAGVTENVTSPTFVIQKIYNISELERFPFKKIVHIDAYRIENSSELEKLKWKEMVDDSENVILIEWAEKVGNILPADQGIIRFEVADEETRKITRENI